MLAWEERLEFYCKKLKKGKRRGSSKAKQQVAKSPLPPLREGGKQDPGRFV